MDETARIGVQQSKIMEETLKASERTSKDQLRPYVLYESGFIQVAPNGRSYTIDITAKNFGQSPAFCVRHWLDATVTDALADPYKTLTDRKRFPMAKDTWNESADVGQDVPVHITFSKTISGNQKGKFIYVWGKITHRDQFEDCQLHLFRLKTRQPLANGARLDLDIVNTASDPHVKNCVGANRRREAQYE